MKPKINFITLAVDSLPESKVFYNTVFGFPLSDENEELCLFELEDDFYIAMQQREAFAGQSAAAEKSSGFILSHNASSRQEVDAIVLKAIKHGAAHVATLNQGWGYSVTIADINGHHWEILFATHE